METLLKFIIFTMVLCLDPLSSKAQHWTTKDISDRVWYLVKYHHYEPGKERVTTHFADNIYISDIEILKIGPSGGVKSSPRSIAMRYITLVRIDIKKLEMYYSPFECLSFDILALTEDYLEIVDTNTYTKYLFISDFKYNQ